MHWSNHIGAVYHAASVNMVTKEGPPGPELMNRSVYKELATGLNSKERYLLKRFFNLKLKQTWLASVVQNEPSFFLPVKLYYSGGALYSAYLSLLSLVPKSILRKLIVLRRKGCVKIS